MKRRLWMLALLLALTLALPVHAQEAALPQEGMTFTITEDMSFRGGPGMTYGQANFNNYPPVVGSQAQVLGRCGTWLLVSYEGLLYGQGYTVWGYLHASQAPEYADCPEMAFDPRANYLGVESTQVYAAPDSRATSGWIPYDEDGLVVLAVYGEQVYIEALNAYGNTIRGFIAAEDLAMDPTAPELQSTPAGTAVLAGTAELSLKYTPAFSGMDVIEMDGGNWALLYDTERSGGDYGVVTAVVDGAGQVLNSYLLRTRDGDEECTVEFMLPTKSGFVVNRFDGSEDATSSQTIFTFSGKLKGKDEKRYRAGDLWDAEGTARYRIAAQPIQEAEDAGSATREIEVRLLKGDAATRLEIGCGDDILCALEGEFGLLLPVHVDGDEPQTRLLIFDNKAVLTAEASIPCFVYDLQLVPMADGRVFLLVCDADFCWRGYVLNPADGAVSPTEIAMDISSNREAALLASNGEKALLAVSGMSTRLLLTDGTETLLAAETSGTLVHAQSDGSTARLLLYRNGQLCMEIYALNLASDR